MLEKPGCQRDRIAEKDCRILHNIPETGYFMNNFSQTLQGEIGFILCYTHSERGDSMLFVVLLFLVISSITVACLRRDKQTRLLLGLCLSFVCMFVGIIIYLAKTGGLQTEQKFLLFFDTRIERKLSYLVFPLRRLGFLIALGRTLFPGFMLMTALNYSMSQNLLTYKKWDKAVMILPAVTLILYYPTIFLRIGKISTPVQICLINMTIVWITVYLLVAAGLLIYEYRSTTIPYCRRQFRYMMGFLLSIAIMYGFYFRQDPIQVYQMYSAEYMRYGGLLYSGTSGGAISRWIVFSVLTTIFGIFGFFNLQNYSVMEREETQGDIMIQKKFDMASRGISVFVHGMKNQLLSNRIMSDKLKAELAKEEPDHEKLKQYAETISEINGNMLKRMEELYRSIKSNAMMLTPVDVPQVLEKTLERFHEKYPEMSVDVRIDSQSQVLADLPHLSEAFYNLLINGYEAILETGKEVKVLGIHVKDERLYVTFEITDNGKGMSRQVQKKIFDPFYTSKNTNNNWGMGLYYVRQIVKSHLGMLRIESTEGKGTTFLISIPKYGSKAGEHD